MNAVLTYVHERCTIEGQHWLWKRFVNQQGTPIAQYQNHKTTVRRLVLLARDGRALSNQYRAVAVCDHPLCVSPHCVQAMSILNSRRLAAERGAYSGNPLRHLRSTLTRRARSRISDADVQRIRADTRSCSVVAQEFGTSTSHVNYIRRGISRRDLSTPWAGLPVTQR